MKQTFTGNSECNGAVTLAAATVTARPALGWTARDVAQRLRAAFRVLRQTPDPSRRFLRALRSAHPETLPSWSDSFANAVRDGKWQDLRVRPALPSARSIDDMDQALPWLLILENDLERQLVAAHAAGVSFGRLAKMLGIGKSTARDHFKRGCQRIAKELNRQKVKCAFDR